MRNSDKKSLFPVTEKTPLVSKNNEKPGSLFFKKKEYTNTEKMVHCCVNSMSCCCDKDLKKDISENKFIQSEPIIAYRGDTRPPEEVFNSGFSAYSLWRSPPGRQLTKSPLQWLWVLTCCLLCCPCTTVICTGACDGDCTCGQSLYSSPFVSNWSALALTLNFSDAKAWFPPKEKFWRYIIYMDGCILFSDFSNDLINNKGVRDPRIRDSFDQDPSAVYDAKEVFPKDLKDQTISACRVIAAAETERYSKCDGDMQFIFNKDFSAWEIIKSDLVKLGVNPEEKFPQVSITLSNLEDLLKSSLLEKKLEAPPSLQMIL